VLLAWTPIGPAPQQDAGGIVTGTGKVQNLTGRISALAVAPDARNADQLILGAAGGGIWTSRIVASPPTWAVSDTDTIGLNTLDAQTGLGAGAIDIGSIAVDPRDSTVVYAGTGEANGSDSRYGTGILRSTDEGRTWQLIATGTRASPQAFFRHSISKLFVDPRGNPRDRTVLYVAVNRKVTGKAPTADDNGIYRGGSTDAGRTWDWTLLTGGRDKSQGSDQESTSRS
jgi:hypothetical protein